MSCSKAWTNPSRGPATNFPVPATNFPVAAATTDVSNHGRDIDDGLKAPTRAPCVLDIEDIDPVGEFKPLTSGVSKAALVEQAPVHRDSVASLQSQTLPGRMSLEEASGLGIILAKCTPSGKDFEFNGEVLCGNSTAMYPNPALTHSEVSALYESFFRELGIPLHNDAAAAGVSVDAITARGPDHVPSLVSRGMIPTIAMDVDDTGATNFSATMEMRRAPAGKGIADS